MRLLFALFVGLLAPSAAAQPSLGGSPRVDPSAFEVTRFAEGLSFPLGMDRLPDGSILVTESVAPGGFYGTTPGRLTRLVDADGDGVAESRQTVVAAVPGGSLTAVRVFGNLVAVVSVGRGITVYRLGEDLGEPLAEVGRLTFSYPGAWQHRHSALAVREAPDLPGAWDLVFQLGSADNALRTTRTATLTSTVGFAADLEADAVHALRLKPTPEAFEVISVTVLARGLRNAATLGFHPLTGDLYLADNGIDGETDPNEPISADVLHVIDAAEVGVVVPDFGFPERFVAYRTGTPVGGGPPPLVAFQPIPDPFSGAEAEGPNDLAFVPEAFPEPLRGGLVIGFHGRFGAGGTSNEENPLVFVDPRDGSYFHLISPDEPSIGHLDGVLATEDALFLADLSPTGPLSGVALGRGVVYRVRARTGATVAEAEGNQRGFTLGLPHPNPSRDKAHITVSLPERAVVVVDVLDPTGRLVRAGLPTPFAPGTHTLALDLDGLPAGLYLVRARSGERHGTHQMQRLALIR